MENHQNQLQQGEESSSVTGIDLMRVDQCEEIVATQAQAMSVPVGDEAAPVKRKRGRPPKAHAKTPLLTSPPPQRKEEDVCFICFDGGDLVLCDRRNCPKAYHPACIKRDEEFFRKTAKWNCGWHICGTCKKASSYMCYTCTYSVCNRCIKDADYVIVRGNMGLCGTCIKPIMLIENISQGDNETVKVDFDDKLSWEYLFKVYWVCLKEELSLTVDELTTANNPWKGVPYTAPKVEPRNDHPSDNSAIDVAVTGTKRRRTSDSPTLPSNLDAKNPSNTLKNLQTTNGESTHAVPNQVEEDSVHDPPVRDRRRRKMRKKSDGGVQNENLDAYAAIDVHNISLIYLKRKYLETLLDDINKLHEKLVGTVLRIKVSGGDQELDIHRLVQVVGTSKAAASYQLGTKTTDVMLEILNLDKREAISVDQLSDQNVTEDECKRLGQSIKCGLNKRLTVGDILKTAATLQALRINEALETDILKFKHLRDRASEKGQRKELREHVERLELLVSPEEHQRLLQEVPEVHTDPSMDPSHASAEDAELGTRKQDNHTKAQSKGRKRKGDTNSSDGTVLRSSINKDDCSKVHNNSSDIQETGEDDEENEIWHYRDPTGKIQGPFSMVQLRRWKSSGHFPADLKISKAQENQDESVLLTDALAGRFDKPTTLLPQEPRPSPHDSRRTGVDVNCLQKNPAPVSTSATSSSSSTLSVLPNDSKEKQVVTLVPCSGKVEDVSSAQVSCSASVPVGHVVPPAVRETSGTDDQSSAVREDGTNLGSVSTNGSFHAPNLNQEIHFPDFPTPTPKSSPEDLEAQAAETIQSLSSCVLVKGPSGSVTWGTTTTTNTTDAATTTSSAVVTGEQLLQITQQDSVVLASPSVEPFDLAADRDATATQTSDNTYVVHSSEWSAIVADPDDWDESVSDLLAEVEAMAQNGLPSSPTSSFHCDDAGPEKDFFNPVARMTLTSETCRMDLSQPTTLDNVSAGTEGKVNTLFNHCGTSGPELLLFAPPVPASVTQDLTLTTTALRLGSETTVEASVERCSNSVPSHDSARGNTERSPRGNGSQQSRSSGNSRDQPWWNNGHNISLDNNHNNRQWPHNISHGYDHGSGTNTAHPPKGLKICKFYESGNCKKGASCSFWHP